MTDSNFKPRTAMKIGQLASRAGCSTDAIRFYERTGLLRRAARSPGNQRVYRAEHLTLLRLIRRCRDLGLALADVKILLGTLEGRSPDCEHVASVFDRHIAAVQARITALTELKWALQQTRDACPRPLASTQCGILRSLQAEVRQHHSGEPIPLVPESR